MVRDKWNTRAFTLYFYAQVYGALLGTQKGRSIDICNSFELVVSVERLLDRSYFTSKEEQCECISSRPVLGLDTHLSSTTLVKQVFSTMEFVGWYTIGGSPTKEDVEFHQQVCTTSLYCEQTENTH